MLSIQIISWMSECKNIYDIFCPESRRLVGIQFFRIIFKEALIVALRFMNNFAYIAFAFNRIALLGKNHPKLIEYISEIRWKKYIIVTSIISVAFSVVKGFKFKLK